MSTEQDINPENPETVSEIPLEAQLLLDEVETESSETKAEETETYDPKVAEQEAGFLVNMAAEAAQSFHPALDNQYPEEVRQKLTERLTPVLIKYEGCFPPWLERWKEEFMLGVTLGGVIFGSYKAIKEYQVERPESAKQPDQEYSEQEIKADA